MSCSSADVVLLFNSEEACETATSASNQFPALVELGEVLIRGESSVEAASIFPAVLNQLAMAIRALAAEISNV